MLLNYTTVKKYILGLQEGEEVVAKSFFYKTPHTIPNVYEGQVKKFMSFYTEVMGEQPVDDRIKVVQGLLLESIVWGYHVPTGRWDAYSYYDELLYIFGKEPDFDKVRRDNLEGNILAYRIDAKHVNGYTYDIELKELRSRKFKINTKEYLFVSGGVLEEIYTLICSELGNGGVYEVIQGGKKRYVTTEKCILKQYTDEPKFVDSLPEFKVQPFKSWLYLPVLGAPSSSSGLTKVELINIDQFKQVYEWDVEKASNGLESMIERSILYSYAQDIIENDLSKDKKALNRVGIEVDGLSLRELYEEILKIPSKLRGSIVNSTRVKYAGNSTLIQKVVKGFKVVECKLLGDDKLRSLLKNGLYKVIFQKSDGSITSRIVTNDNKILESCYGKGWFAKYSTDSEKKKRFVKLVVSGVPWEEAVEECGLPISVASENTVSGRNTLVSDLVKEQRFLSKSKDGYVFCREVKVVSDNVEVKGIGINIHPSKIIRIARVG